MDAQTRGASGVLYRNTAVETPLALGMPLAQVVL